MFNVASTKHDFSLHLKRRQDLVQHIKHEYSVNKGIIILFGGFEQERIVFRQESSFYYFTGITEPGVALVIDLDGPTTLYVPHFQGNRAQWMVADVQLTQENAQNLGFDAIKELGEPTAGYTFHPFFPRSEYHNLLEYLGSVVRDKHTIFTLSPLHPKGLLEQRLLIDRINTFVHGFHELVRDIATIINRMRRSKDMREIELLYRAVGITQQAHEAAANVIADGVSEAEVHASLEYMFTGSQARPAFPSIVASGANATILHYHANNHVMHNGDLVVVDIGAEYEYYCADITRTYPVSGTFTPRQKEIYNLVLEAQEYIASIARPGYWLSNKEHEDKSLNHLARKFFKDRGYDQYFLHGLGHFLGLDVHDVGDYSKPLQEGDIITIEPGLYLAQERIGVRIEDDYWVVKDGVVCLSEHLPKRAEDIEAMVQEKLEAASSDDSTDDFDLDDTEN